MTNWLFDIQVEKPDPVGVKIKEDTDHRIQEMRRRLHGIWSRFEPYADKDFCKEFARRPHQRFWEMFLACHLINNGKQLIPKSKHPGKGPDILIEEQGRGIWIEAVAPPVAPEDLCVVAINQGDMNLFGIIEG